MDKGVGNHPEAINEPFLAGHWLRCESLACARSSRAWISSSCVAFTLLSLLCQNLWLFVTHPVLSAFQAFQALRLALEQQYLSRCSCSKTTEGVKVDVSSRFEQASMDG